jgi:hypothetical protein
MAECELPIHEVAQDDGRQTASAPEESQRNVVPIRMHSYRQLHQQCAGGL